MLKWVVFSKPEEFRKRVVVRLFLFIISLPTQPFLCTWTFFVLKLGKPVCKVSFDILTHSSRQIFTTTSMMLRHELSVIREYNLCPTIVFRISLVYDLPGNTQVIKVERRKKFFRIFKTVAHFLHRKMNDSFQHSTTLVLYWHFEQTISSWWSRG